MGTQYNGLADNISGNLPAAVNIASSTNASPTVITTSGNHGLTTGDTVDVLGHTVNVGANGTNDATVLSLTTFSIPVDTSGGTAGGATGTVQSLECGPTYLIPADGDAPTAASVNVAFEALGDRTAFLYESIGLYKIVYVLDDGVTDDTGSTQFTYTFAANNTWTANTLGSGALTASGATAPLQNGDVILFDVDVNVLLIAVGAGLPLVELALFFQAVDPGAGFSTPTRVDHSARWVPSVSGASANMNSAIHLAGAVTIATAGSRKFNLSVYAQTPARTNVSALTMIGDWRARCTVYRPTGVKQ
jgi:hypothetical protein